MSEPKKVGRRTFLNYAIAVVATGVIVGAATYFAVPKGEVTVTAPGATTTVTSTAPGATTTVTSTAPPPQLTITPGKPYAGTTLNIAGFAGWICYAGAKKKIPEFEEATGIKVNLHEIPFPDILTKPLIDFSAGTKTYDLTMTSSGFFLAYYPYALVLNDFVKKDLGSIDAFLNMLYPPVRERVYVNGAVKSMPIHANIQFIEYRRDLIEDPKEKEAFKNKYGYDLRQPRTYQELVDIAKFFTRGDMDGFVYWGEGAHGGLTYSSWLWSERRIPWVTNDFRIDVEYGPGRETAIWLARWLQDLTKVHKVTPDFPASVSASVAWEKYRAGKAAMVFGWMGDYWGLSNAEDMVKQFGPPGSWSWVVPGGWWSCWALIANKNTDNPGACWEFMKWNASLEVQAAMAAGSGQASPFIEATKNQVEKGWTAPAVAEQLPVGTFPAFIPRWIDIEDLIYEVTPKLISFEYTPEQYIDTMVQRLKEIRAKG